MPLIRGCLESFAPPELPIGLYRLGLQAFIGCLFTLEGARNKALHRLSQVLRIRPAILALCENKSIGAMRARGRHASRVELR